MTNYVITDNEINQALNQYTQNAAQSADKVKGQVMSRLPRRTKSPQQVYLRRGFTAIAALALMIAFFVYTPTGIALAAAIEENIINKLFPPKDIAVNVEGFTEETPHLPLIGETADEGLADYAIYIDETHYYVEKENQTAVIRPLPVVYSREDILADMGHLWQGLSAEEIEQNIDSRLAELEAFYSGLPECKIEIQQISQVAPQVAAAAEWSQINSASASVTEIEQSKLPDGLYFQAAAGAEWDSLVKEFYFIDNQQGGTFVIIAQYYLEASEGHGSRFRTMIESFAVITEEAKASK